MPTGVLRSLLRNLYATFYTVQYRDLRRPPNSDIKLKAPWIAHHAGAFF